MCQRTRMRYLTPNRAQGSYGRRLSLHSFIFLWIVVWGLLGFGLFSIGSDTPASTTPEAKAAHEKLIYHNNIGIAYLEQFNFREALGEFNQCLQIDNRFVPALVNSAIAYYYLQDSDNSAMVEDFLKKGLSLEPNQPNALFLWGIYCRNHNHAAEALEAFNEVLAQDPSDVPTLYQLGQLALDEQRFELAAKHFRKIVELSPYDTGARYSLAKTLIRQGNLAEGTKVMERFMELKTKGGISSTGTQYGQQGRYMMGVGEYPDLKRRFPVAAVSNEGKASTVRFVEATASAGIRFQHKAILDRDVLSGPFPASLFTKDFSQNNLVAAMGSGAAFCDYDRDGQLDLFLANCSGNPAETAGTLYRNTGNGQFEDVTNQSGLHPTGFGMGVYWIDYNNDEWPDLFLTGYGSLFLYQNKGNGTFVDVTSPAGLKCDLHWHLAGSVIDYDHDGSLDIFAGNYVDLSKPAAVSSLHFPGDFPGQGCHLYHNNGNGTFSDVAETAKLYRPAEKITSVLNIDFDNRRDIDFWTAGGEQGLHLFSNERVGTFQDWDLGSIAKQGAFSLAVADYDLDDWMDLAVLQRDGKVLLMQNRGNGVFSPETLPRPEVAVSAAGLGWAIHFFDYNNDGRPDLFILRGASKPEPAGLAGPELWENRGDGIFQDVTASAGLETVRGKAYRSATFGDYDNDGDVDVLLTVNGGSPVLLRNEGGNQNHWIKVRPEGTNSSRMSFGTKVEVKAGRLWQKVEVTGGGGYLSQNPPEVIFGLGRQPTVDALRLLWPKGVLQAEVNLPINQPKKVKELDRKGTSCPLLYTWDGTRYRFVTDFLGGCGIGFLEGPGRYSIPDTDEYVKISAPLLQARAGKYSLKINNQLEEVLYIDQSELLVLDHPSNLELYPNERLMPFPPYPEFKVYAAQAAHPPRGAWGNQQQDVLPLLREMDRTYPQDFRLLPYKGYAEEHELVLDLGDLPQTSKISLLLTAWIDYADSTANYAAAQAGQVQIPPYLQVKDERGEWQTVIPNMGFPAGLPKTMVVDLSGKFLTSDYHVRIMTNMRIYWDQILVNTFEGEAPFRQYRLSPGKADFQYCGFPREFSPDGKLPLIYNYDWIEPVAPWKNHTGSYTRYGDVTPLLHSKDDMFVIMCHGEEIHLDFDAARLPLPPPGWTRSFFFYADGFGKDMDHHSTVPGTVEPLPFHGMSSYPYPPTEMYPDTPEHREYLRKYNTRTYQTPFSELRFSGSQSPPPQ